MKIREGSYWRHKRWPSCYRILRVNEITKDPYVKATEIEGSRRHDTIYFQSTILHWFEPLNRLEVVVLTGETNGDQVL